MTTGRGRTGTLTFLVTDLVRMTELVGRMGDEQAEGIVAGKMRLLTEIVGSHGGDVFTTVGDTVLAVFESTLDSIGCAVSLQEGVARDNAEREAAHRLDLAVAIHSGEAIFRDGDYFGTPVIVVTRLISGARPGQIVVSGVTRALAGSRGGFSYRPLAPMAIKGFEETVEVFEVVWRDEEERTAETAAVPGLGRGRNDESVHSTAVILCLDVVDSTAITHRIGDAAFRERSRELDVKLRGVIRSAGGDAVAGRTLGDGLLALFPSARQAMDAAFRCLDVADAVQLQLHTGIHAGDVIREGGNAYGGAVNIAARIADLTAPNEILVSATVRDLARTSSDVMFDDRGEHALKGVDEPARVFAVRQRERS